MFKSLAKTIGAVLPDLFLDVAGLAGAGSIAYGAWLVYPPAGFIVGGGLVLLGAVLLGAKASRRSN